MSSNAIVKFPYVPQRDDELQLNPNDTVKIIEKSPDGWWKGEANGQVGWFPSNYVDETINENFNTPESSSNHAHNMEKLMERFNEAKIKILTTALYDFDAESNEELSIFKGERLEIIEQTEDDWWKARNDRGQIGLIPRNYVEFENTDVPTNKNAITKKELPSPPKIVQQINIIKPSKLGFFEGQPWYYGKITRDQGDYELNSRGDVGDFLVRDSENNPGDYSISVKGSDRNKNFLIHVDKINNTLKIGNSTYKSMEELIDHYTKSPIFSSNSEHLYLVQPLPHG